MKKLIENTAILSTTEFALIFVTIFRNKYLAVYIGPEGFGEYGVLNSFFIFISMFSGYWLANGVIKYTAEYKNNDINATQKIFDYSFSITFFVATLIALTLFLGNVFIKKFFLSHEVIFMHYAIFAASFIGKSINIIFSSVMQGLQLFKKIVFIKIIGSLFELMSVVTLVYFFSLTGFFISIFIATMFSSFLLWKQLNNVLPLKFVKPDFTSIILRKLFIFGGSSFLLTLFTLFNDYFMRILVLKKTDLKTAGLLQASLALMGFLGILNRGASFYFFPLMSEKKRNDIRTKETNEFLRLTLLTSIPISFMTILFGPIMISILYSSKFLPLANVLYWFVLANFLSSISQAFFTNMMGLELIKEFTFIGIIGGSILLMVPFFLIDKYGYSSVAMGYIMSYLVTISFCFWYLNKEIKIRLSNKVINLLFISIVTLFGAVYFQHSIFPLKVVWAIVSLILVAIMIEKNEYIKFYGLFFNNKH